MPRPPGGFEAEKYPLKHKFYYAFTLSAVTGTMNSAYATIVKSYKGHNDTKTVIVNQHRTDVMLETGAICNQMSIVDNLKITIKMNRTAINSAVPISFSYMPVFGQFTDKWDASDQDTSITVAAALALTKDATQEDLTPLTTNKLDFTGESDVVHPLSTVNLTELYTHLNMTTDNTMEDTVYDADAMFELLRHGTNKGALKTCIGKRVSVTLHDDTHPFETHHYRRFMPSVVKRIMPFTYFGLLFHIPLVTEANQHYSQAALTASKGHVGFKVMITYDEWHPDHNQDQSS